MKPTYSALIRFDTSQVIALELARPLSPETAIKIKKLEENEGIAFIDIPEKFGKRGYYITISAVWNKVDVARECLKLLISEGFAESDIYLDGFTAR